MRGEQEKKNEYTTFMHIEYSFCECKRLCTESRILGTVGLEAVVHLYVLYLFIFPPVASAPTNLMAVQEGPTGIRVSWIPTIPLKNTTGYRIYYRGGSSGSVNVSDGSTDNYLLGDLQNGANYTIHIVGISKHFFSEEVKNPNSITLSELLNIVSVHGVYGCPYSLQTQFLASPM